MARPKKTLESEISQPEDDQPKRGRKKLVEAEHTIKYSAPVPVTVEEETDPELIFDDDLGPEIEERPRRKTAKSERDELRKKLAQSNVTPGSQLKLTIERYPHSEATDGQGGTWAETEHCAKYPCTEAHITGEDYLDVARKWGPGLYRFTLRMANKIVTAWDKRISGGIPAQSQVVQHAIPGDPTSPQVVVHMPEGQQQVITPADPFKEAERALKLVKQYNEAFGMLRPQSGENPVRDEEEVLAGAILKRPEVIENVVGSVIKRFGASGGKEEEPWYAEVVKDAVRNGQAVQIVKTAIDGLFNGFKSLIPAGGQNNGQAKMAQAPQQNQSSPLHNPANATSGNQLSGMAQTDAQGASGIAQSGENAFTSGTDQGNISPEDEALSIVITHCQRNLPVQIAFNRLIAYADAVNDQAPQYSIDGYLEMFATMPVEGILDFVKTLPNGETVASLPHCKEWTEALQKLIRESQGGEE
jgi:hypothetical protein